MANLWRIYQFFKLSPKKKTLLNYIAEIRRLDINRREILIGMCKTRGPERDLAYEHFDLALPFIVKRSTQKIGIIKQNGEQSRC